MFAAEGQAVCKDCDRKRCDKSNKAKIYSDFDPSVWDEADGSAKYWCRECTRGRRSKGMWVCRNRRCKLQKPIEDFSIAKQRHGDNVKGNSRVCDDCIRRREAEVALTARKNMAYINKQQRAH